MKKKCARCGKKKNKSEFYRQKDTRDGYGSWCKECHRVYGHTPAVKEMRKKWRESPQGRQKVRASQRKYDRSEKGKQRFQKVRSKRDKGKVQATSKVGEAVKRGKLPHISTCVCADCGQQAEVYHHDDYKYPLMVVSLCKKCHAKKH